MLSSGLTDIEVRARTSTRERSAVVRDDISSVVAKGGQASRSSKPAHVRRFLASGCELHPRRLLPSLGDFLLRAGESENRRPANNYKVDAVVRP